MRGSVERFRAIALSGTFRPAVATLVGGTMLGRVVIVAASPFITRLFTPAEFGEFAAAIVIISILTVVADLSYRNAIGLPASDGDAANLVALSIALATGFGIVAAIAMSAFDGALLSMFGAATLSSYALVLVGCQIASNIGAAFSVWATRMRTFRALATGDVSQSIAVAGAQVAFGVAGLGVAGLLGGWAIGVVAGALILTAAGWRLNGHVFVGVSIVRTWSMAKRYRRFAFMSTPSALMNTIGLRAPLLILLFAFGTDVGGQYALAERVAILPVTLIAAAVSQVYYSHAAPLARRQDDALRSMFLRTTRSLALLAIAPMIIAALAAPFLFGLIFGDGWVQAGVYSAILAPWFYVTLVTNPTGRTLDILERQDLHLVREGLRLSLLGSTAVAVLVLQPPPVGAVIMLSIVGCITYGLYGYISWRAIVSDRPRPGATMPGHESGTAAAPEL